MATSSPRKTVKFVALDTASAHPRTFVTTDSTSVPPRSPAAVPLVVPMNQSLLSPSGTSSPKSYAAVASSTRQPAQLASAPNVNKVSTSLPSSEFHPSSVTTEVLLSRQKGVVVPYLEDVFLDDYLQAITQIVPRESLTHASRVNGDVYVYVSDPCHAERLITQGLCIFDEDVPVMPLPASPSTVVISNVPPEIPEDYLRDQLSRYGTVVGPIRTLKAATSNPLYSHILSFRRSTQMVFATDADKKKIPPRVTTTFCGHRYTFYITIGVQCYHCREMGHIRRDCPEYLAGRSSSVEDSLSTVPPVFPTKPQPPPPTYTPIIPVPPSVPPIGMQQPAVHHSPVPEPQPGICSHPGSLPPTASPEKKKKKRKTRSNGPQDSTLVPSSAGLSTSLPPEEVAECFSMDTLSEDDGQMDIGPAVSASVSPSSTPSHSPVSHTASDRLSSHRTSYPKVVGPLSHEKLVKFVTVVKGSPNPLQSVSEYTSDIPGLITQLRKLAAALKRCKDRSTDTTRISNLARRLEKGVTALL